jgi:hypothetical protein
MDSILYNGNPILYGQGNGQGSFQLLIYGVIVDTLWANIPMRCGDALAADTHSRFSLYCEVG